MKFSLLLPTYNRADIIGLAIESVIAQTEQDWELLIVGDGCTDNTAEVVSKYVQQDARIKWFDYPKAPGFGYANRNQALRQAKGGYVGFIAHDDLLFPDHLALLGNYLDTDPSIDIVYSRPLWVDDQGIILPSTYNLGDPAIYTFFMERANGIPASCFIHRRNCFDKVGYWNEDLPKEGDWDMWKRIIKTNNFRFETQPTTFHFKAIWKSKNQVWPPALDAIAEKFVTAEILPDALQLNLQPGELEQQSAWNRIQLSRDWLAEVRTASTTFIDRLVQLELPQHMDQLTRDLAERTKHLHETQQQVMELEVALDKLNASKFMQLRRLLLKLIPEGGIIYKLISRLR